MGNITRNAIDKSCDLVCYSGYDQILSEDFPTYTSQTISRGAMANFYGKDVIVDVSSSNLSMEILSYAKQFQKPLVLLGSRFTSEQESFIEQSAQVIPIFKSTTTELNDSVENILEAARFIMRQSEPRLYGVNDLFNE